MSDGWNPAFLEIDPRLGVVARAARAFAADADEWPRVETWNARLQAAGLALPVDLVPQRAPIRRRGDTRAPYDAEVARHARVPSRERCWHDFLNMLVWATFPKAKLALHRRQLDAAAREDGTRPRGRERDALSMLDEGGVLLAQHGPVIFGHALLEHLVLRRPLPLRAAVLEVGATSDLDEAAARRVLDPSELTSPEALRRIELGDVRD